MKTTFRFVIAAMGAISMFSSCQKDLANETANSTTDGVRIISVQFDNPTKATIDGFTPKFENDDQIRVSNDTESEVCTVSVDGSGNATFTTNLTGDLTAIYPAAAAVLEQTGENPPIVEPYFKVLASQDGTMATAIIAKATIPAGSSSGTFIGQTALFEITPPLGATSFTIKSLKQIGTDGQRSGAAVAINTEGVDAAAKCIVTVTVPSSDTAYVSLVPGVNLTDLSFDAGETYGMKGIPMKDITASGKTNATAANTKYTIGNANNTWHPYVEIEMTVNSVTKKYKWSTMNVGAATVATSYTTCYGDLYEWGSVEKIYDGFPWASATDGDFTDKWKTGKTNGYSWTTYCGEDSFQEWNPVPYNATTKILNSEKDAATQNWGTGWRMPTKDEFYALYEACDKTGYSYTPPKGYTTTTAKGIYWCTGYYGVAGLLFITKEDGPHLFFPAAGSGTGTSLNSAGSNGYYWSSSLNTSYPSFAYSLYFNSGDVYPQNFSNRYHGFSVRPVSDQ